METPIILQVLVVVMGVREAGNKYFGWVSSWSAQVSLETSSCQRKGTNKKRESRRWGRGKQKQREAFAEPMPLCTAFKLICTLCSLNYL